MSRSRHVNTALTGSFILQFNCHHILMIKGRIVLISSQLYLISTNHQYRLMYFLQIVQSLILSCSWFGCKAFVRLKLSQFDLMRFYVPCTVCWLYFYCRQYLSCLDLKVFSDGTLTTSVGRIFPEFVIPLLKYLCIIFFMGLSLLIFELYPLFSGLSGFIYSASTVYIPDMYLYASIVVSLQQVYRRAWTDRKQQVSQHVADPSNQFFDCGSSTTAYLPS